MGNHFRDKLQSIPAIDFIEKRQEVQQQAQNHIAARLQEYRLETRGVYIQDVVFPAQLVQVLTARKPREPAAGDLHRRKAGPGQAPRSGGLA